MIQKGKGHSRYGKCLSKNSITRRASIRVCTIIQWRSYKIPLFTNLLIFRIKSGNKVNFFHSFLFKCVVKKTEMW